MYKNMQPLSPKTYPTIQLKPAADFHFAATLMMIPLASGEIVEASKYYPIVFTKAEHPIPVAILGLAEKNIFINDQGQWLAPYIPARIRTYPFALAATGKEDQYAVLIDVDAPHFVKEGGKPLFDAEGKTAPWVNDLVQYLVRLQKEYRTAQELGAAFQKAGLIADRRVDLSLKDGQKKSFQGFLCLDETVLNDLSEEKKKEMETNGEMAILKAQRASLIHFNRFISAK